MSKKQTALFLAAILLLLAGRLFLAGTGYLDDSDELLYVWIHQHFAGFAHLSTWVQCINDMRAQPPELLIRVAEYACLLPVARLLGRAPLHPDVLFFAGIANIVVSLLTLAVFFRVLVKLRFPFALALCGMLLLGTLANYNLYTRHLLPYAHGLLFQLLAFNFLLREKMSTRVLLAAGFLSAIGLTCYMGTFMFSFINAGMILMRNSQQPRTLIKQGLLFLLPFAVVALGYEALTRSSGTSYLRIISDYAGTTYSEGSFSEGLSFVFIYFYLVEKWWGVFLLLLFFAGSIALLRQRGSTAVKQALAAGIVAYILYGSYVLFFHTMVFEGRVLHQYYPFIIIGALALVQQQKPERAGTAAAALAALACINYGGVLADLNRIGYPRTTLYRMGLFEQRGKTHFNYYEEVSGLNYRNRSEWSADSVGASALPQGNYELVNVAFLQHYPDSFIATYRPFAAAPGDSVLFQKLHFQSHPAYTLEYCTREGRRFFMDKQLQLKVVKRKEQ